MARSAPGQVSFPWDPKAGTAAAAAPPPATTRRAEKRAAPKPALVEGVPRWLTADAATVYLGFPSRKALYAAVERGQVPAHRLGRRRLRFKLDELDSLLGRLHESDGVH